MICAARWARHGGRRAASGHPRFTAFVIALSCALPASAADVPRELAAPRALDVPCEDLDGDGVSGTPVLCGPVDCDDSDPAAWQLLEGYTDGDGDGHVASYPQRICAGDSLPSGWSAVPGDDCNDDRAWRAPAGGYCTEQEPIQVAPAGGMDAADFALLLDSERRLRVWYTRFPPFTSWQADPDNSRDFGSESTFDLLSWRDEGPLLDVAGSGGWDDEHVWAPSVVFNPLDGRWWMLYAGVTGGYPDAALHRERIGAAVSDDLETWTRLPGNGCAGSDGDGCLFDCNLPWTAWSDTTQGWTHQCRDPHVVRDGDGSFYLAYAAAPAPFAWTMQIGIARSADLTTWTDLGPVPPTLGGKAESPHLFRHDGLWYLLWTHDGDGGIRYATTPDLAAGPWSAAQPVPDTSHWTGTIASEILDVGDRLIFAHAKATSRDFAFRSLAFDADGVPRPGSLAPLDCLPVDPAAIRPGVPDTLNGLDDDCDALIDGTARSVRLLAGPWSAELARDERLASWFAGWDATHARTRHDFEDSPMPGAPWPGGRLPHDLWRLWIAGECDPTGDGDACLDTLVSAHDVIVVTFDAEASDLLADTGLPDPACPVPTLENVREQWRCLRAHFDARPQALFLVWTPPPRHRLFTPVTGNAQGNAERAAALAAWLRDEWLAEDGLPHPNIAVFDVRALTADDAGLFLRPEFERYGDDDASLPGVLAAERVAPLLGQAVINALSRRDGGQSCRDDDGDGYGAPACSVCVRRLPDCDDSDPRRNPGMPEVCGNDADENCDGLLRRECNSRPGILPHVAAARAQPDGAPREPACWAVTPSGAGRAGVAFAHPAAGPVRLSLYDARGARIAALFDGWADAGEHLVPWNGRDEGGRPAAAGVYFVLFETGGRRTATKLILLR